ncbi:molybdopterin molybdotransferase MoeA [Eubacterium oxidoreducens]|uniref:Molybdopterin molybdenumtransferase n=1 Tax=Eubacterium oxidoreducens TaxID=1732 RepID=A0A1G6BNJ3_EUBOX|nr:molybdopterin molybdotransferase MoeA [Eubacterium oxidoreducens]SDB22173.1 molybdopterin molybdotransferase [Eubacterium oxidoreducens]
MRDHSNHRQVNKQEAVRIITENCRFTPESESVPIQEAIGRILAQDVCANWDNPNTLTCRMDSVAVHWADFEHGMPDTSDWVRGKQWEFANTGVAMPQGFDTAIVVEHVVFSENDTKISFDALPSGKYAGTSAAGSKMKKGDLLVEKGTKITPLIAAHIVSGNHTHVQVVKKPKVLFMPTGNELVPVGGEIPKGKNIESNSYMIAAKIEQWGGEPMVADIVPDTKEALKKALHDAAARADIIVLNAGSSKGNDDWGIEMLEEEGTIFYHQTNHGPGHHSSFGILDETPVVGISGPPAGAAFTTDYYLYPAMMVYFGKNPMLSKIKVRLGQELGGMKKHQKPAGDSAKAKGEDRPMEGGEFYSVKQLILRQGEDGVIEAYPTKTMRPGAVEAEGADAYYLMPTWEGQRPPQKGDMIEVELRP